MGLCPGRCSLCSRACEVKASHRMEKGLLTLNFFHPCNVLHQSQRFHCTCVALLWTLLERWQEQGMPLTIGRERECHWVQERKARGFYLFPASPSSCSQGLCSRWVFEGQDRGTGAGGRAESTRDGKTNPANPRFIGGNTSVAPPLLAQAHIVNNSCKLLQFLRQIYFLPVLLLPSLLPKFPGL